MKEIPQNPQQGTIHFALGAVYKGLIIKQYNHGTITLVQVTEPALGKQVYPTEIIKLGAQK